MTVTGIRMTDVTADPTAFWTAFGHSSINYSVPKMKKFSPAPHPSFFLTETGLRMTDVTADPTDFWTAF
jgi:hypothetical protein